MDNDDGSNDPKYKQFNEELNHVLTLFTKSTEWADFIKCLGKLAKVFEKFPKSTSIQSKLMISKRLSQCLNPSLPSGCHSKALDTYDLIFNRIGQEKLSRDISIYATGLFPLFHLASTDVRFKIITLYEKHFLPLGYRLYNSLSGIVSSLLPGLEEGQGEIYESVQKLLDQFCRTTSTTVFYQAIWKSLITTPYNRQAAINYLLSHLPKDFNDDSNQVVYLPEKDTLVAHSLSVSLLDPNILVQRNILEVISIYFPLSTRIFSVSALEGIILSALKVVTSKDMSLNRRLYSWLLGPQEKSADINLDYFIKNAKDTTVLALKKLFIINDLTKSQEVLLPFRVLTYLFQREEFQILLNDILYDILRTLNMFKDGYVFSKDVVRHVDDLLDCVNDQQIIWNYLTRLLEINSQDTKKLIENVKLVECFLDVVPLSVEEVQSKYLPSLLLSMLRYMKMDILSTADNTLIVQYTQLSLKIIGKIIVDTSHHQISLVECIETYQDYFVRLFHYLEENLSLQVPPTSLGANPITLSSTLNINTLSNALSFTPISSYSFITSTDLFAILDLSLQVLVGLFQQFKTSPASPINSPILESSMPKWFLPIYNFCLSENPFISCLAIKSFIGMATKQGDTLSRSFKTVITMNHLQELSKKLWSMLDPNNCAVHYKVATLFLALREMNESVCSSVIAEAMLDSNINNRIEGYQKFALFWRLTGELGSSALPFSNTLFLMLDSLHDDQPIIRLTGHTWLADSISKAERILDPLLKILLDKSTIRFNNIYQSMYDARRVIYAFKILKAIIECDFKLFIQHVIEKPISKDVLQLNESQTLNFRESPKYQSISSSSSPSSPPDAYISFGGNNQNNNNNNNSSIQQQQETSSDFLFIPTNSYIDLLVVVALRFIQGQVPSTVDRSTKDGESFIAQNDVVQICATEFLQYLLAQTSMQPSKAMEIANYIQEPILQNLAQAVSSCNMVLQVHLLSLLRSIVLIDSSVSIIPASTTTTTTTTSGITNQSSSSFLLSPQLLDQSTIGNTSMSSITQSPMFLQTTVVGLIQPSTRFNIRFYWLDFITFCLPRMALSSQLPHVVLTIVNCLKDLVSSFDPRSLYDSLTARDIIVLLKSLTFILKFSILEPITPFDHKLNQDEQSMNRGGALGGVRIFADFVKDVFTTETDQSIALTPIGKVRDDILNELAAIITPLLKIWGPPKSHSNKISMTTDVSSDTHNKYAIQDLIIHILDPLASKYQTQFLGAVVDIWQKTSAENHPNQPQQLVDAQNNRKVLMEIISSLESIKDDSVFLSFSQILSSLHTQERLKPPKSTIHKITTKESALYDFVYRYIDEYPTSFDMVSSNFLLIVRESLHSSNPMTFVSQLQILNVYIRKMVPEERSKNTARYKNNKRELQDIIPKIIEACFMISGKSFTEISALYIPPNQQGGGNNDQQQQQQSTPTQSSARPVSMDFRDQANLLSIPQTAYTYAGTSIDNDNNSNTGGNSSNNSSLNNSGGGSVGGGSGGGSGSNSNTNTPTGLASGNRVRTSSSGENDNTPHSLRKEASRLKTHISLKSLVHLSKILASLLDIIFDDKERIAALLANTLHNIVPYMKSKVDINRENSYYAICLFSSLSEYSYNIKTIKKDALELFFDYDFFKADIKTLEQTAKIINQVMIHDKTALSDFMKIIGKTWTQTTALMFVNKETENMNRSKQLKRLSFILWSGTENQYLSSLPTVQEKIVEALRIPGATVLHIQVFTLLRVLLLRISHQNLRPFWPIILTELIDILSHQENGELVLQACKFLDLALTIPSVAEQFSLFEWVFIKDCFVPVSQKKEIPHKPFVDKIAQTPMEYYESPTFSTPTLTSSGISENVDSNTLLRPCIMIRSVNDLPNGYTDFKIFLQRFSTSIYQRHQTSNAVDYQFINEMLCLDFCEIDSSKLNSILLTSTSIQDFGSIVSSIHQQQHRDRERERELIQQQLQHQLQQQLLQQQLLQQQQQNSLDATLIPPPIDITLADNSSSGSSGSSSTRTSLTDSTQWTRSNLNTGSGKQSPFLDRRGDQSPLNSSEEINILNPNLNPNNNIV